MIDGGLCIRISYQVFGNDDRGDERLGFPHYSFELLQCLPMMRITLIMESAEEAGIKQNIHWRTRC